jgi:hypothetical protein
MPEEVHPIRIQQVASKREVSATPRDLTEDQRIDSHLRGTKQFLEESGRARNQWQLNRVNPLCQTKWQLKKARKTKRLREVRMTAKGLCQSRLAELRAQVIRNLNKQ